MRKALLLVVMVLVSLSLSTDLFAGEVKTEEKRIYGEVIKTDCDKSSITISEIKGRKADKGEKTELTLKFTDKTNLLGVKVCNDIVEGTLAFGKYLDKEEGNILTRLSLRMMKTDTKTKGKGKER